MEIKEVSTRVSEPMKMMAVYNFLVFLVIVYKLD
jgi:hypothetical protein